ncbi:MAG: hypothetical protein IH623_23075 [Verrucomicrobia bacterium]|nr:hypothetical protein [Verrucomicrobiota bacterium]
MNPLNHKLHVNTPQRPVALLPPPVELLKGLSQFLPFGLVGLRESQYGERFGLVMQCGERELYALKQQSVEVPKDKERRMLFAYDLLIAHSLAGYLTQASPDCSCRAPTCAPKTTAAPRLALPTLAIRRPRGLKHGRVRSTPCLTTAWAAVLRR